MLKRMKNLSVPHRLYGAFAIQVGLLVLASLFVFEHVTGIRRAVVQVIAVELPLERTVEAMERSIDAYASAVLRYNTSLDPKDRKRAEESKDRFAASTERFKKLAHTNSQRSLLREVASRQGELQITGSTLMDAADSLLERQSQLEVAVTGFTTEVDAHMDEIDREGEHAAVLLEASFGMMNSIEVASGAARAYTLQRTTELRDEALAATNKFTQFAASYESLSDQGEVFAWLAAARDGGNEVRTKIINYFDTVDESGQGQSSFRADVDDLMGRIGEELRPLVMQERAQVQHGVDAAVAEAQIVILVVAFAGLCLGVALAMWSSVGIMGPLQEAVRKLSDTSDKLAKTSRNRASGAQEQVASVAESMATVTEVARTAEQAADRATTVADSVRQTDTIAQSGRSAVGVAVKAMARAKDQTHSIAENIVALAEQAKAIGEIITSVNDIAEQTNLLSLNASIEASRAGEHGKGFQVVAGEVKELAGQSKMATRQVREILGEIQKATSSAVLSTEDGTHTVENAVDVVSQAGDTINSLAETIANAADAANQIAASATQQATAMMQIKGAMEDIDKVAQNNASSAKEFEDMASDLSGLGSELHALVRGVAK